MSLKKLLFLILFLYPLCDVLAQSDSSLHQLKQLSPKYLKSTENKIDKYSHRVSAKTEKTLTRLAKWEAKVQKLLQKASPEAAAKLFSNPRLSFKGMLEQYQKGEAIGNKYKQHYDEYRDKLTTQIKYLDSNKTLLTQQSQILVTSAKAKTTVLEKEESRNEELQKMIRERKKQLLAEAMKHLGKNKQLQKISKEAYYYA